MICNRNLLITLFLLAASSAYGFSPASKPFAARSQATKNRHGAVLIADEIEDELTYRYLLGKAQECAFSDRGTAREARMYLHQILQLQSACVSGIVSGHDLCDNVDEVAEIVAHLRQKVEQASTELAPVRATVAFSTVPLSVLVVFATVVASTIDWGNGATPFTMEEWQYAARDGYLVNMIGHLFRNGGL